MSGTIEVNVNELTKKQKKFAKPTSKESVMKMTVEDAKKCGVIKPVNG